MRHFWRGHDGGSYLCFFICLATQKYVENGHSFSRGRRNRFYIIELGSITASISSFSYAAVTGILLQSCPLLATAQHWRAMRLAMATIATFLGFFAKMFFTQSVRHFDLATA